MREYWYVSQYDVEQHPRYGEASLDEILYDYGMEVKLGYKDDERWKLTTTAKTPEGSDYYDYHHTSLSGHKVKCPRYVGLSRNDGKWRRFISDFLNCPAEFASRG